MALNVHEWGNPAGRPLICLHGVGGHGARFRKLAEERLGRFRVVAPDLRGHGGSPWEPPWTIARHVDDVRETLVMAGIARAELIGHSFGARVGLELAALDLVERLVLLDPAVWIPPPIALERAQGALDEISFSSIDEAVEHRSLSAFRAPRSLLEEEARAHLVEGDDGRLR